MNILFFELRRKICLRFALQVILTIINYSKCIKLQFSQKIDEGSVSGIIKAVDHVLIK
jgi:hypothetical protein